MSNQDNSKPNRNNQQQKPQRQSGDRQQQTQRGGAPVTGQTALDNRSVQEKQQPHQPINNKQGGGH
jgi:hypothetical protein